MSQFFSNNDNSLNTTVNVSNYSIADERPQILTWLSPLEPRQRHQDIRERRVENVGEWILQTEEFKRWYTGSGGSESDNAVLFCYGGPGVGKTYISSLVIDRLCDQTRHQNATVACFYFDFAVQKEQSSTSVLRALLKQLVGGLEEIPEEISRAFQDQRNAIGGREPGPSDIVKMLQTVTSKKRTFICIDGLDECLAKQRAKLLNSLDRVFRSSPGTRIFVTGRPQVGPEVVRRLSGSVASISIAPRRGDIMSYLRTKLAEDTTPDAMDSSLEADILKKIPNDISEMFLLVSLNINAILQETTISRRRQKLSTMTDGLGDAYSATLGRIKGQGEAKSRLGMAALMWISHAERGLKVDELCHALAVKEGSRNLDAHNVPSIGTLLTCCQGLVIVDKGASTIRLIHFTLQEYLRVHSELFGAAHSTIAETCLSYLNSREVKALSTSPSLNLKDTSFLEYSSLYWGIHAKRDLSGCAKTLALNLLDDCNSHISTKIFLKAQNPHFHLIDFDKPFQFNSLHCASIFGIDEIVTSLVEAGGCDINQKDHLGNTPLLWAALSGHEGVVKILLGRGDINPDEPDKDGQTPLWWAAFSGHEGVVKILLGRGDVSPNKPNVDGQTPLCCATWDGREGVVKILLERGDVNPDKPDNDGRTPLCLAAMRGHEGVVRILLERDDLSPDEPDKEGRTPLSWAAWNVHERVVKILLACRGVKPDKHDNDGRTPLWWAAWIGHEGIVKRLLGRDGTRPDRPDKSDRTPLWVAAENGHEELVKILLGQDDVNPHRLDKFGRTPLWWAAQRGHAGVVALLKLPASPTPGTA